MDSSKFDELTKALASNTSRRQAIKTLAASTFGGLLAFTGLGTAFAKTKKCPSGQTDCGGKCVDTKTDPNNCGVCGTKCRSGLCVNGLCCPPGAGKCGNSCCSQTCCSNTCVDTQHDKNNCGSCGNVCPSGDTCKNGKCVTVGCPAPCITLSNGTCARPCSTSADCTCGSQFCGSELNGGVLVGAICTTLGNSKGSCLSDSDCPIGYYCNGSGNCDQACC